MSLLDELKRRNVIRMAGLYLVGAWLVTQVAATLLPVFEAPSWAMKAVVLVLAAGFLPALAFAWAFELTPAGLKRDSEVTPEESIAPQTARRLDRMMIGILAIALVYFAFDRFALAPRREAALIETTARTAKAEAGAQASAASNAKSIAVMAFDSRSSARDNEYFADGIAEEILNSLAKVRELKVAGRRSSCQFKGKGISLGEIGNALGVGNILEGSVRKQGNRLRITAQLSRVNDGVQLWSETFDGTDADVFALQESIARKVTDALKVALDAGSQSQRLVETGTANVEAYQLYLRASSTFDRRDGDHMADAVKQLQQAVLLDPGYARAYSRLAAIHAILPTYVGGSVADSRSQVRINAQRASELDPQLAEPWAAMGLAAPRSGQGLIESRQYFERAMRLDPDDITSNFWFGLALAGSGYTRAGVQRIEHALEIDPMVPNVLRWRGVLYLREGDVGNAKRLLDHAQSTGLLLARRELGEIAFRDGDVALARHLWSDGSRNIVSYLPADALDLLATALYGGNAQDRVRANALVDTYIAEPSRVISSVLPLWMVELGRGAEALEIERTRVTVDNPDFMIFLFSPAGKSLRALAEFPADLEAKGLPALWDAHGPPDICPKASDGTFRCD